MNNEIITREGIAIVRETVIGVGLDAERFLLFCPAASGDPDRAVFEGGGLIFRGRPMSGVTGDGSGRDVLTALHAFPVVTLYEAVGLMRTLNVRGQACTLWDVESGSRATGDGHPWLAVREGWPAKRIEASRVKKIDAAPVRQIEARP